MCYTVPMWSRVHLIWKLGLSMQTVFNLQIVTSPNLQIVFFNLQIVLFKKCINKKCCYLVAAFFYYLSPSEYKLKLMEKQLFVLLNKLLSNYQPLQAYTQH